MQLFYIPKISVKEITLEEEESKHCIRVLRKKLGDTIDLTDGIGFFYKASIIDANPKRCKVEIIEKREDSKKRNYSLHIAMATTKNIARFEWFVEKAIEIGVDVITPIFSDNSERMKVNKGRFERIVQSACKQSLTASFPVVNEIIEFKQLVKNSNEKTKLIAHCINDTKKKHLKELCNSSSDILILIGPEGDFSPSEVKLCESLGFKSISLGNSRLRTETAGVMACAIVNAQLEFNI